MYFVEHHQKVVLALIAGITIIAISGIFSYTQKPTAAGESAVKKEKVADDTGDADRDSVPDWQEILYGTDPNKKDSNTLGISDKEYIETKKKEREALFNNSSGKAIESIPEGASTTDVAADTLIGMFLSQQNAKGTNLSEKERSDIIKTTIKKLDALPHTVYDQSTLLTSPDTSTASVIKYQKTVATILKKLSAIPEYELQTYARAVDKNDPAEFKKLSDAADIYESISKDMLLVRVPIDMVEYHAGYINSFSYTAAALKGMSKGFDDVIGSYRAFSHFGKAEQQFRMARESLRVYLTLKDIPQQ